MAPSLGAGTGDVTAAFLQSRVARTGVLLELVRELREAMDLLEEEVAMLFEMACGLCDSPTAWFDEVRRRTHEDGTLRVDPV